MKHKRTAKTDRKAKLRSPAPLSIEEIHRLLEVSPPERRLTYEVALATAFRANELRSLTVASLDVTAGGLHLEGRAAKSRKRAFQPLPTWLVTKMVQSVVGRAPTDRLLYVPGNTAEMIRCDFDKAGIARITSDGKVDFHALRATAATLADDNGGSVKDVQEFARHSTPQMTYSHYVKARTERLSALAERIGAQLQDPKKSCPTVVESGASTPEVISASPVGGESSVASGERPLEGSTPPTFLSTCGRCPDSSGSTSDRITTLRTSRMSKAGRGAPSSVPLPDPKSVQPWSNRPGRSSASPAGRRRRWWSPRRSAASAGSRSAGLEGGSS